MPHGDPIPQLKRQLAEVLKPRLEGWRAADIAALLGTDQARVSELRRGILHRFSLETLIRYARRVRFDVSLTVVERRIRPAERPARGDARK